MFLARLAAVAALLVPGAAAAMTTPALLDPAAIAGAWTLTRTGGPSCSLTLSAEPSGRFLRLDAGSCAKVAGVGAARQWRVSNDGIGLATEDGSTVIFLSRLGPNLFKTSGQSSLDVGGEWTLTRG